ncbi:TauD/TfdA family dioxygenase [Candidatus Thioglobus sp.]|jgi:taurine dioxygenase|nr:TauD/TfdA family dioxygenase [Candidatus Thioglobus sp.]MDA9057980.1 TauD/TfdA family dioxygenase [Candidatus Thioglobus sp.]MDA9060243.1 TauD/TfdA family dioxygenase [Candidatus Thioglobus sp.]MDC3361044.1 TauD/TfdA family dioxygenase [Candidatus Thioglobus sp.]
MMLKVTPLTPSIGATISGVSLNKDLNIGVIEQIYSALIKHQVVFFRDQNISPETHLKLAESLGEIDPGHPVYPHVEGYQSIVLLKNDANNRPDTNDWHKDLTFKESPPFASILHGVKVPKVGGDTLWASMSAAYDQLPNGWKDHLEELEAIHDMGTFRNDFYKEGGIDSVNNALKNVGSAVHKVIGTHPISGLKYLNVNQSFTRNIVNESQGPSDHILQFLFQHISKPEFQVRFHWEDNSVAIWDNRITQHYAVFDYLPEFRHMQRVTVVNDKRDKS